MFSRFSVAQRLFLGFGITIALTLAITMISGWKMIMLAASVDDVASRHLVRVSKLQELRNNLNAQGHQVRNILISGDRGFQDAERNKAVERVGWNQKIIDGLLAEDHDPKAQALLKSIAGFSSPFASAMEATVDLAYAGNIAQARESLIGEMRSRQMPLFKAVDESITYQMNLAKALASSSTASARATAWSLFAAALAALVVATATGFWISRNLMASLGAEPVRLSEVARRVAAGELHDFITAGAPAKGSVMAALAEMQSGLRQIVGQVRASSDSIATGSSEIATGNQDLSQRTELQASALQQTAATMEQLRTTVHNNSERAVHANRLAQDATAVAAQGGEVVSSVVSTMQDISHSSRKIGDIIGVIDGIAFQTNILALNAAVEAARAGEQGRGFAVVAGEVRTLAQRSADAAKEIKFLIGRSMSQVDAGTQLVDQAGSKMDEIVGSIRRVSDIVSEISAASVEQGAGIRQVGDSVIQMDQVTQQNAALVEQGAAAAESLKTQARQLVESVAVFRLSA